MDALHWSTEESNSKRMSISWKHDVTELGRKCCPVHELNRVIQGLEGTKSYFGLKPKMKLKVG